MQGLPKPTFLAHGTLLPGISGEGTRRSGVSCAGCSHAGHVSATARIQKGQKRASGCRNKATRGESVGVRDAEVGALWTGTSFTHCFIPTPAAI